MTAPESPAEFPAGCAYLGAGVFFLALGLAAYFAITAPKPVPPPPRDTAKIDAAKLHGQKRGEEEARAHAACAGCGMPMEQALVIWATNRCNDVGAIAGEEQAECRGAFVRGFRATFAGLRGPGPPIRLLRVEEAKPGVQLYDGNGEHLMTILSVEGPLMIVRYAKDGTQEPKDIRALSTQVYVKLEGGR